MNPELFWFEDNEKLLIEFENLLREKGESIRPDSSIANIALTIREMYSVHKKKISIDLTKDYREDWRRAIGLNDLIRKIVSAREHPDFANLWPHILLLLNDSNIVQNIWSPKDDEISNKIFELYMALSLIRNGANLKMDNPKRTSRGKNPDILIDIDKHCWAFACKAIHSNQIRTLNDRIREGLKQIDNSDADRGIVLINLKNLIDHDSIWSITRDMMTNIVTYKAFPSAAEAYNILVQMGKVIAYNVSNEIIGDEGYDLVFNTNKAAPFALVFFSTVVTSIKDNKNTFTYLRLLMPIPGKNIDQEDYNISNIINDGIHDRL